MRVDAHHHVWRLDRGDYGWLKPTPALSPIYRDFELAELGPALRAAGISATVLVQAAPTTAETRFLLDVARNSAGLVRGVVGWADLEGVDAVEALRSLATDPLLKAVRPMLQDLSDPSWIARPEVQPALAALPSLGLRLDALVTPRELKPVLATLEHHSDLAVIAPSPTSPAVHGNPGRMTSRRSRARREPTASFPDWSPRPAAAGAPLPFVPTSPTFWTPLAASE